MTKNNFPNISIFIPTYNDRKDLSDCLESIRGLNYPKQKIQIIIWDNASHDNTVSMVQKRYKEMEKQGWLNLSLIKWHKNEGSYIPYNMALPYFHSETEFILGLDADVELDKNTLSVLIEAAQDRRIAVVGARSVYFDKPDLTSHGAGFVDRLTARYGEKDAGARIECDYVIGCCWLLNRAVFQEIGRFDPDFYINHWEVDFCLRAKQKGYRIIYEPLAIARHKIPIQCTPTPERIYYLYRNKLLLIKKNSAFFIGPWSAVICAGLSLLKLFFLAFDRMGRSEFRAALSGLVDGLKGKTGPNFRENKG